MDPVLVVKAVIGLSAFLTAVAVLWRMSGFGRLKKRTGDFLDDWNGDAPRPGYTGRKSFPLRMSEVEETVAQLKRNGGTSVADAVHDAVQGIEDLKRHATANSEAIGRLDARHNNTDKRISEHRQRNDDQAEVLRVELERRAQELKADLAERNRVLDERLGTLAEDVFRAQAARAILTELGHKIEPEDEP